MGLALLIDATAVFAFQQYLKQHGYPIERNINYGALLDAIRRNPKIPGAEFSPSFAFVSILPGHEGQQKFCKFLADQGLSVVQTDFRDAFIIPKSSTEGKDSMYQRLSSRITYMAGMLTSPYTQQGKPRSTPHLVIVTDAFDVYYPLLDYVQSRSGKVTIAFFRAGMEDRWQRVGLFDKDSPIEFCDLSEDGKAVFDADLGTSLEKKKGGGGFADFELQ